jgi:dihydrofolate reductase
MKSNRSVILYIAVSVDGYIAAADDDLSFLSVVSHEGEDYGYADFINTVDTVVMGRKTYSWVKSNVSDFPHSDKEVYIITRTPGPSVGNTKFYTGNPGQLILNLKKVDGKNIFIDGGAEIVNQLLYDGLIDEFVISVIPVLLGNGIRLFKDTYPTQNLKLVSSKQFETGLVQSHYRKSV